MIYPEGAPPPVDLTNCDREPIHIPGAILPHGAMLVLDPESLAIEQVAGDTQRLLGIAPGAVVGRPASDFFSAGQIAHVRGLQEISALAKPRHLLDPLLRLRPDMPADASVHLSQNALVIEFEEADLADPRASDPLASVQEMLDGLMSSPSLQSFCQAAAERVRMVTGYDRVMVYRFLPDDSGWVFAETKRADLAPFLDLHYPASDIPSQARALYKASWLRLITQVDYTPAPLTPPLNPRSGQPLDMSQATLRNVSPIHREYLRNMGVDASMSISILCRGRLWGLISCHHYTPRRLPRHLRAVCELFGSMFSLQLEARLSAEQFESQIISRQSLAVIMKSLAAEDDYAYGLARLGPRLLDYISSGTGAAAGGLALRVNNRIDLIGATPDEKQILELTDWLTNQPQAADGIYATDCLGEAWSPARRFQDIGSGLLSVSVSREPRDYILWFRPETVRTVQWGGDPNKPVETGPHGDRLTPRKSFEIWSETVRGRSAAWSDADRAAAFDLRVALLEVVLHRIDTATRERLEAWEQQKLLMAELDHRVKNTLANISAMITQTSRNATSLRDYVTGLNQRIQSMSRAHSLLTQSRWEGASVSHLLHEELDAFARGKAAKTWEGPGVMLTAKAALGLSMAIHELTTNAAKYGALSVESGKIDVTWRIQDDGGVSLLWAERDGPPVAPPRRTGFGSTLIERALAMETGGDSRLSFRPGGVVCEITLPASAVQRVERSEKGSALADAPLQQGAAALAVAPRVLVVEDSALVMMFLEDVLSDIGWKLAGPATRLEQAKSLALSEPIDAALLDVNLHGEMSWEVAAILERRKIPYAFTTGYDGHTVIPTEFLHRPVINKPFQERDIVKQIKALLTPINSP